MNDQQPGSERRGEDLAHPMLAHPVRAALMDLLHRRATVTSTEAAQELGGSSGLHSFHLRQLARYGLIEEAPAPPGRVRPWRLAGCEPDVGTTSPELGVLARGLEDESYHRWLALREQAPRRWQRDEAFSQVCYLTPRELTELGRAVRGLIAAYGDREEQLALRPPGAAPVAVVARLFPLLGSDGQPLPS